MVCPGEEKVFAGHLPALDFGFEKFSSNKACLSAHCGTPGQVAPIILEGATYGTRCDMWIIGINVSFYFNGKVITRKEWIQGDDAKLEDHYLGQTLTELKKLNAKRKFKAAVIMLCRLQCDMLVS